MVNKNILLQIGMMVLMLGIMVYVGITINAMINDPNYIDYAENIYVPLPGWIFNIILTGVVALIIFLFAPLSCNGIPYIFWIISSVADKVGELKERMRKSKEEK